MRLNAVSRGWGVAHNWSAGRGVLVPDKSMAEGLRTKKKVWVCRQGKCTEVENGLVGEGFLDCNIFVRGVVGVKPRMQGRLCLEVSLARV